jgi:uncharacterized protein (DUF1015 family)
VVIADGHHRYETMLHYRDECREATGSDREAPHEFVLGYLVNALDPGTKVRGYHRIAQESLEGVRDRALARGFAMESVESEEGSQLLEILAAQQAGKHAFVLVAEAGPPLLLTRARGPQLDIEILHTEVLDTGAGNVRFDAETDRVISTARSGEGLGILVNPVTAEELFRVVQEGRVLPQKSTYFSPKVASGLVLRDLR